MDMRKASRATRRAASKFLEKERNKWPDRLIRLPDDQHPENPNGRMKMPVEIWRSRDFLLQVFAVSDAVERLSVNRTAIKANGHWEDNISWEELQTLKEQCGRGHFDAVEVFPSEGDEVNVANMRHLWVLRKGSLDFIWRSKT